MNDIIKCLKAGLSYSSFVYTGVTGGFFKMYLLCEQLLDPLLCHSPISPVLSYIKAQPTPHCSRYTCLSFNSHHFGKDRDDYVS